MFPAHLSSWTGIHIYSSCGDLVRLTKSSHAAYPCHVDGFQCQSWNHGRKEKNLKIYLFLIFL